MSFNINIRSLYKKQRKITILYLFQKLHLKNLITYLQIHKQFTNILLTYSDQSGKL